MTVRQDPTGLIDKESGTIQHSRLFFDVGEITRKVDEVSIIIEAGEIKMLTIKERDIVVEFIADEYHTRLLFAIDLLRVFLTADQQDQEKQCY